MAVKGNRALLLLLPIDVIHSVPVSPSLLTARETIDCEPRLEMQQPELQSERELMWLRVGGPIRLRVGHGWGSHY
jgi:hypothetical protein